MTALFDKIYVSDDWPKNFLDAMIALPKKDQTRNRSDHRKNSLILHTGKIVAPILSKRLKSKTL